MVLNESNLKNVIKKVILEYTDPWSMVTYKIHTRVLFAGFDECDLSFSLVFKDENDAAKNMDSFIKQRLDKEFNNIVRYEIIKTSNKTNDVKNYE